MLNIKELINYYPLLLFTTILFGFANLQLSLRLFEASPIQFERIWPALAFGTGAFASTLLMHLPVLAMTDTGLQSSALLLALFVPTLCAFTAHRLHSFLLKMAWLAFGFVFSHEVISNSHSLSAITLLWVLTTGILYAAFTLADTHQHRFQFSVPHRRLWLVSLLASITLTLTLIPTETEISSLFSGSKPHDIPVLLSLIAASGLLLLYLRFAMAIKHDSITLWRALFAIIFAEFGIMFLLPPIMPQDSPIWLAPVLDGGLLSLFVFPLLLKQRMTSRNLVQINREIQSTLLAISDGVIVCDNNGLIRHLNRTAEGLLGISAQEASGKSITDIFQIFDDSQQKRLTDPLTQCLQEQTLVHLSNHAVLKSADGKFTAVEHSASPIFDAQQSLTGAILICRDVTQRRKHRQQLEQEAQLRNLINTLLSLPMASITLKQLMQSCLDTILALSWLPLQAKGGVFLTTDSNTLELVAQTGLSEQVKSNCAQIQFGYCLCGQVAQKQKPIYKTCLDDDHEFHHQGMADHGHYNFPLCNGDQTLGVIVLYLDERHSYEEHKYEALNTLSNTISHLIVRKMGMESRLLAHQIVHNSHQGVLVTDAENKIIDVNPSFATITGYTLDEVKGKYPSILSSDRQSDTFYREMWQTILSKGIWQGEIWNRNKAGEIYPEWLTINVLKDNQGEIQHYIGIFSDLSKIKNAEENIAKLAYFDPLTSLPNRSQFSNVLTQALSNARRNDHYLAVLFLDLDRFKAINDSLGHIVGDDVLHIVSQRFESSIRESDIIARWGGDEFVLLLQADDLSTIKRDTTHVADKLLHCIKQPISTHGQVFTLSASIGISIFPEDTQEQTDLIQFADTAMYHIKREGTGNYLFFSSKLNRQIQRQRKIELALTNAIVDDEFELYYQPKVLTQTEETIGFEALLRWTSAELGSVSPAEFIPIAEDTNLIMDIDEWVFEHVCLQLQLWTMTGVCQHGEHISVNLASRHLQNPSFIEHIIAITQQYEVPTKSIQIEITETGLMDQTSMVIDHLHILKEAGFSIAMDDFGTGHSSLARLKELPIDLLKIDRSFIQNITTNTHDKAIVSATIQMAHALGIEVCAEGVETSQHADILKQFDCRYAQGYLYAKPVSADEAAQYLDK